VHYTGSARECTADGKENTVTSAADYYRFDDAAREVRFLRADPPTPWMNYLSNGNFHMMMSQAGGGLAWYRSPQIWRITRYRFYNLPMDRPGPYLYFRDEDGTYWSPSAEPCAERPAAWSSAHGPGYTRFTCAHRGLEAAATYFVPPDADVLIWRVALRNRGSRSRALDLFAYVEFSLMNFLEEIMWGCYEKHMVSVTYRPEFDGLWYHYGEWGRRKPEETPEIYLATDRPLAGWDGNRDVFIGSYRSEANPRGLEEGCKRSELIGGDPCGALQCRLVLEPGAEEELTVFLGAAPSIEQAGEALRTLRQPGAVEAHWQALGRYWVDRFGAYQATLPDADAARQVNTWNPYQVEQNFRFSRSLSYYALGFRGVGFRDTAQDCIAMAALAPDAVRLKIHELLAQQYQDGHANHMCFPVEEYPPVNKAYSDDHLWPIYTVWSLIAETGDRGILDDVVPFFDGGEGTVYDHLCRAFDFSAGHLGERRLPLILAADWNDAMSRVGSQGKGESFWTAMQLGVVLPMLAEMAATRDDVETARRAGEMRDALTRVVNELGWDGEWYRRAIMDDGRMLGTHEAPQAQIFLNTQSWSVLSGMGTPERQRRAMDAVARLLDTPLGIKKVHPPVSDYPDPARPLFGYFPGLGENGAIFCHANTWAIIAECLLDRPERAWKYYRQLIPHLALQRAGIERYMGEPYAYASNLFGPDSERFGLANVTWLTGTAAWMYVAVTQYLLGVRPEWDGLRVAPCLPADWPGFQVERRFRGCRYHITVTRAAAGEQPGLTVDGMEQADALVRHVAGRAECRVCCRLAAAPAFAAILGSQASRACL